MNRRRLLSLSGGSVLLGLGGCLDRGQGGAPDDDDDMENDSEPEPPSMEEIRETTCTPPPDDESELDYTKAMYEDVIDEMIETDESDDTEANFAVISTAAEAESRLNPKRREDVIRSFVDETNFEDQVLLVWNDSWGNTRSTSEVIGITQPDTNTIHTYLCEYGVAGGNSDPAYVILIRVAAPQPLQQATFTLRKEGYDVEEVISTREETTNASE